MSDIKEARALLNAAERDISALRGMGDAAVFADAIFGFHVQQAAEKLLKAWLALSGETYPRTHDLRRLLEMLAASQPVAAQFDGLIDYAPFAVQFRYVEANGGSEPLDRGVAVKRVERLLEEVRRRMTEAEGL